MRTRTWCGVAALAALVLSAPAGVRAQGQREGITVHGDWVIEIRQPDGALVSRREFKNALRPPIGSEIGGAALLARLLNGQSAIGKWEIIVGGVTLANPIPTGPSGLCRDFFGGEHPCDILEPDFAPGSDLPWASQNLVRTPVTGGLRLSGSVTVLSDGHVRRVGTAARYCDAGVSPCTHTNSAITGFTDKTLTAPDGTLAPIPVRAGQIVQAQVTLSFQ